jgi:ubiquinone/menaquinone biosynthesis C-methylase UbiE
MTADFRPEDHYSESVGRVYEAADVSRDPLSTDGIFDIAAECGVSYESLVLDIGCAKGCTIEGVDFVEFLVRMGRAETKAAGLEGKVNIQQGTILDIPFPDDHFDFLFCRDMLSDIEDLPKAVSECERVEARQVHARLRHSGH